MTNEQIIDTLREIKKHMPKNAYIEALDLAIVYIQTHDPAIRAPIIVEMRDAGMTLEEIGKHFGVTRERVRQIYEKETRRRET